MREAISLALPTRTVRRVAATFATMALLAALIAPGRAFAVPLPGESCPTVLPGTSSSVVCGEGQAPGGGDGGGGNGGGDGSFDLGGLLPILGAALGGAAIALVAAFLVIRRRTSAPAAPADPTEWWTCTNCGKTNVIDSPRCYACGTWHA